MTFKNLEGLLVQAFKQRLNWRTEFQVSYHSARGCRIFKLTLNLFHHDLFLLRFAAEDGNPNGIYLIFAFSINSQMVFP